MQHRTSGAVAVYHDGTYLLCKGDNAVLSTCHDFLAPAMAAGLVHLHNPDGSKKPAKALLTDKNLSTTVKEFIYSYGLARACHAPLADTLKLPASPLLKHLTATHSPRVQAWLEAFIPHPETLGKVLQWLAITVKHPHDLLQALVLTGPKNSGKNLFAHAVASLFSPTYQPVAIKHALGEFPEPLLRQCVVFADEGAGFRPTRQADRNEQIERLKEVITQYSRQVNQKGLPLVNLEGPIRLIVAANDHTLLGELQTGSLNAASEEAFLDRFILVSVQPTDQILPTADMLAAGEFANHFLWLAETVQLPEKTSRFRIDNTSQAMKLKANFFSGKTRTTLMKALDAYAEDPTRFLLSGRSAAFVHANGSIILSIKDLDKMVQTYVQPLHSISTPTMRTLLVMLGREVCESNGAKYYEIPAEVMQAWRASTA